MLTLEVTHVAMMMMMILRVGTATHKLLQDVCHTVTVTNALSSAVLSFVQAWSPRPQRPADHLKIYVYDLPFTQAQLFVSTPHLLHLTFSLLLQRHQR